jgi:SAM-dependent methyltransferase
VIEAKPPRNVKAHKTAISRKAGSVSAPYKYLASKDLIQGRVLDYGCGKGLDADKLSIEKFDPHYFPQKPTGQYDTIICNYVLNVVKPKRGREVLAKIKRLLKPGGVAYITVRADVKEDGFRKGGTYQRDVKLKLPLVKKTGWYRMYKLQG